MQSLRVLPFVVLFTSVCSFDSALLGENCSNDAQSFTHRAINADVIPPLGPPILVHSVADCMHLCCDLEICTAVQVGDIGVSSGEEAVPCLLFECPTADQCQDGLHHDSQYIVVMLGDRIGNDEESTSFADTQTEPRASDSGTDEEWTTTMETPGSDDISTTTTIMMSEDTSIATNDSTADADNGTITGDAAMANGTVISDVQEANSTSPNGDSASKSTIAVEAISNSTAITDSSEEIETTTTTTSTEIMTSEEPTTTTTRHHGHHHHTTTESSASQSSASQSSASQSSVSQSSSESNTTEVDAGKVVVNVNVPNEDMLIDGWTSQSAHAFQRIMLMMTMVGVVSCILVMALFAWVLRKEPNRHDYTPIDEVHETQLR